MVQFVVKVSPILSSQKPDAPTAGSRPIPRWVPVLIYLLIAAATLGVAAFTASTNMIADQPNRDIWQHIAAVRALMENLTAPQNPFVASAEPSRHFQPLWVATAAVGNAFGLTVWQAVTGATFAIMATLAVATHVFARTYFGSRWAPSVLLSVMLLAWLLPHAHTGLHSMWTLLYAAAYPATFLIALSLLQWALVIRALADSRYLPVLAVLSALMLATHQLGAVIGVIGAVSFVAAQPGAQATSRVRALAAIMVGLAGALAWPYFNPAAMMLAPGNSSWEGGPDFYFWLWMPGILLPAGLGLLWLGRPEARPLALALFLYFGLYLLGLLGVQIASRFLMPVVLILHIALCVLILEKLRWFRHRGSVLRHAAPWLAVTGVLLVTAVITGAVQTAFEARYREAPDVYAAAERMTRDVPDDEEIAVFRLMAWPVVATGQRVLSVPWPEPGIADLAERQEMTAALFDPALSPEARRALAERLGVRVMIADRRELTPDLRDALELMSFSASRDGTLQRYDLWQ